MKFAATTGRARGRTTLKLAASNLNPFTLFQLVCSAALTGLLSRALATDLLKSRDARCAPGLSRTFQSSLLAFCALMIPTISAASWWDCGWVYRSEIAVTATGSATNYPLQIELSSSDFHAAYNFSSNGSDIRVVDSDDTTPLDFFIDEWNVAAGTAVLSVNVPQVSPTDRSLYIYYGSDPGIAGGVVTPPISASSAEDTFLESGWRLHTRFSTIDPASEAEGRSLFNNIEDDASGYGCTVIDELGGRNNRNTFSGPRGNYGLMTETHFQVDIPGVWEFRLGADYGLGGGLYVNGQALDERWNEDIWWALNWNNSDVLTGSIHLEPGFHHIEALGYEGCCDGTINMQFRTPGSGVWLDMSADNLSLYGRSCPPGVIDENLMSVDRPSFYSGSVFYDNGTGGSPHDGVRDSAEEGVGGVNVQVTVASSGSSLTDQTDSNGNWLACFLDEAVGSNLSVVATTPADTIAVSESSSVTNTDTAINGTITIPVTDTADIDNNNIGIIEVPRLESDSVLSLVANGSKTSSHTYYATTTSELSFQISSALHEPDQIFSYLAYRDANCDGVAETPAVPLSNPVAVVAGEEVCIIIEVQASAGVDGNSRLTLQVDAETIIADLGLTLQSTNLDEIFGLQPSELVLEKSVCNLADYVCDVVAGSNFSYYNAGQPGERLRYKVTFYAANDSVSELTVTDSIPAFTTLEPLSISMQRTPAGVSCSLVSPIDQSVSDYKGTIEFNCSGTVNPMDEGIMSFTVVVD